MTSDQPVRATSAALRTILVLVVTLSVVLGMMVSGCSKETESLEGTWTSAEQGETLDFRAGGVLYFTQADGQVLALEWQADDRHLAIAVDSGKTETFGYSIKDGVLTLTHDDEEPAQYERIVLEGE